MEVPRFFGTVAEELTRWIAPEFGARCIRAFRGQPSVQVGTEVPNYFLRP
jgi:hypothetical protein